MDAHFPDLLHLTPGRCFDSSKEDFSWLGATAVVLCPAKFNVLLDRIKCVYGFWWNLEILGLLILPFYGKMNQVLTHGGGLTLGQRAALYTPQLGLPGKDFFGHLWHLCILVELLPLPGIKWCSKGWDTVLVPLSLFSLLVTMYIQFFTPPHQPFLGFSVGCLFGPSQSVWAV